MRKVSSAFASTGADASVGQVRRDGDLPALVDAHSQNAAIDPGDEPPEAHLAVEGLALVMAAGGGERDRWRKK